jgi:hypothetical protein
VAVLVWREGKSGREWLVLHRAAFARDDDGDWAWSFPTEQAAARCKPAWVGALFRKLR